jgi:hypothetical protein
VWRVFFMRNCVFALYSQKKAVFLCFMFRIRSIHTHRFIVVIICNFIQHVLQYTCTFHRTRIYVQIHSWPCVVLYPRFLRRHSVVCCHVCDKLWRAAGEESSRNAAVITALRLKLVTLCRPTVSLEGSRQASRASY